MSTAFDAASVILPQGSGYKAGKLYGWRPDVKQLQDIDVARAASTNVASRVNSSGVREFVGANVPRWDWSEGGSCPSLLDEPQRTNLFDQDLAGSGVATQVVTVVDGTEYTVSVEGSGSIALTGAGTGTVTEGNSVTFTADGTSLTCTLTGSLDYAQVEAGAKPTSIIYTSGSTATRNKDLFSVDLSSITTAEYTVFFDIKADGARLLMEAGTTGFDLDITNSGRFAMLVGATTITFQFPDNGQPQTSLVYEKPADFRNISFEAKLGTVRINTVAWIPSLLLAADYNQWLSGTVSSSFLETNWSAQTNFTDEFNDEDWEYFPLLDVSSGTNFSSAFRNNNLTSFPPLDVSSGIVFSSAFRNNNLTSFPLLDVSSGAAFAAAWRDNNLTSFPLLDVSLGTTFISAWSGNNLTSFPLLDLSSGDSFTSAWQNNSLTSFPANRFDSLTVPALSCFVNAWAGTNEINAQGMENILVSIDTSGADAPASGVDIGIASNGDILTAATNTAITNLKAKGWTITIDGVPQ